jgi:excinuclease UvrABC nuclease subunit
VGELARETLPDRPGIYVFTSTSDALNDVSTLYVGKADGARTSLRERVWGYCVTPIPLHSPHAGRQRIFQYRKMHQAFKGKEHNLFVRWTVYSDASGIEGALIHLLTPTFNTRIETVWADEQDIDPRYIGEPYQCAAGRRRQPPKR